MFTKNITISALVIAVFAMLALALPVSFSNFAPDTATVSAWGGGDSDGSGGESGTGGGNGCGGCGGGFTPTPDPTPEPEPKPPVCRFLKANGQIGTLTLPYGGGLVDLTWASFRATGVILTPDGSSVAGNGSQTVNVTSDASYTLRVTNGDGSDTCRVNIDVQEEPALTCQDVVFDSNPSSPVLPGTSVNLSWVFTGDVSAATIDNGIGDAFAKNNEDFVINNTTTFNATIANATSQKVCPYTIIVQEPNAPSCDTFTASPTALPSGGGQSLLKWTTSNADSVSIDNGVGVVLANNTTGYPVNVTSNTTYTMTVSAAGYDDVTCPASITVGEPEALSCEDNVSFTSSDYSLGRGGGDVTLAWTTTGIDSLAISGVSSTNLNDSEVVNVSSDATYTLQATADGQTINCPLSIDVATSHSHSSSPKCDLDISDEKITKGESVTLTWDTTRAKEVRIEDDHGNVLIDSDDSDDFDGEMTIKPTEDTEYTLFSKKGTKQKKCTVEVALENNVTVLETRSREPRVAGISLTQVPYTGFDAGPALTMIFYALLTFWGLFVAYVAVIRRKSVGGVSFAGAHDHVDFTDQSVDALNTQESSIAEGYVHEATASVPTNLPTAQPLEKIIGYDAYVEHAEKKTMDQ